MTNGYTEGHPWYYRLGGPVPRPSQIREDARASGYRGWRERYILQMAALPEPQRSIQLRNLREEVLGEYRRDISGYRVCANALRRHRQGLPPKRQRPAWEDVHTDMGLKYCHLFNDFAHLCWLDDLLARQADLFG